MVALSTDSRQIQLFYNSNQKNHREIFAYAKSAGKDLLAVDVSKDKVAGTVWTEIADLMNLRAKDLIHTDHSIYEEKYGKGTDLDCNDAIAMLQKDPDMLIYPIAIYNEKAIEAKLYSDILEFFDPDTAAIDIP